MDENHSYTCEKCGKKYPVAPKWCPCEPYPMADPYEVVFLLEVNPDKKFGSDDLDPIESVLSLIAGKDNPFKTAVMIKESMGWEFEMDEEKPKEPETLDQWIEHYFENGKSLKDLFEGGTGIVLLKENFSPGVETLDTLSWYIVEISKEDQNKLLSLAGMCGGSSCSTCG